MKRIFFAAIVALAPAAAAAQIVNTALPCSSANTYWPRGDFWAVSDPAGTNPIPIYFEPTGPVGNAQSPAIANFLAIRTAIMGSFSKWTQAACTGGTPNLAFKDAGNYTSGTGVGRNPGDTLDTVSNTYSSFTNVIYWVENSSDWKGDSLTVALTWSTSVPAFALSSGGQTTSFGAMLTSDMQFNGIDFNFRVNNNGTWLGCTAGTANCFDVGTVSLHEAGHFIGLYHVQCSDAMMYPSRPGTDVKTDLPNHEIAAVCAMYPPRSTTTPLATGETCNNNPTGCPSGDTCITPLDSGVAAGCTLTGFTPNNTCLLAWCAKMCVADSDCGEGHICHPLSGGGGNYCMPGLANAGVGTAGAWNWCQPCTSGDQCQNGVCITYRGYSYCASQCAGASSCPTGFTCTTIGTSRTCWPDSPANCQSPTNSPGIDDVCFQWNPPDTTTQQFNACLSGLMCVGFKQTEIIQNNQCLGYQEGDCDILCTTDSAYTCPALNPTPGTDRHMTCCFGLDAVTGECCLYGVDTSSSTGSCLTSGSASSQTAGGCFQIREEGESCVLPEQSVCDQGLGCFSKGNAAQSICYQKCPNGNECLGYQTCNSYTDPCNSNTTYQVCEPAPLVTLRGIGIECTTDKDCDSGYCYTDATSGQSACSRICTVATSFGCPGNIDIDGDGKPDGGFTCAPVSSPTGACWPKAGHAFAYVVRTTVGCCSAVGESVPVGDLALASILWAPIVGLWWRRRRQTSCRS